MNEKVTKLISLIKTLKEYLGPEGRYSICKSDGGTIELWEMLAIGSIFEAIDEIVAELQK